MPPEEQSGLHASADQNETSSSHSSLSVCHVITGQVWAGAQVQVATLLKALSEVSYLNLYAIVFEEGRLAQELRGCGVRVEVIPQGRAGSPGHIISQSSKFLEGKVIDIIHAHGYKENIVAATLARWCRIPSPSWSSVSN